MGAHTLPDIGALGQHSPRNDSSHRVCDDAHRLSVALRLIQGQGDLFRQSPGLFRDGAPPVEWERPHLVSLGQEIDQIAVIEAQGRLCTHTQLIDRKLFETACGQAQGIQPHAVIAHGQVTAHDPRQHEADRPRPGGCPFAHAAGYGLARPPYERLEPVISPFLSGHGGDQLLRRLRIREVSEMADVRSLVEEEAFTPFLSLCPAPHRGGVHDQIVLAPVEPVRQQELELAPHPGPLDVAGDDAQFAMDRHPRTIEERHAGRIGHHRRQTGEGARIGVLLDHREDELGQDIIDAAGLEGWNLAQEVHDHRQPAVDPLGGKRRTACRTGDPHEALDADVFCL